jgi:hypothetical protein
MWETSTMFAPVSATPRRRLSYIPEKPIGQAIAASWLADDIELGFSRKSSSAATQESSLPSTLSARRRSG